jgi:hypothetical protein
MSVIAKTRPGVATADKADDTHARGDARRDAYG